MIQIIATEQLARELEKTEGIVELIDVNGKRLGTITRPPSSEDVRIATERLASDGPRYSTDEVISHIEALGKK